MTRPDWIERARRRLVDRHEWQLYVPMYGIVIAFKRYSVSRGIFASPWVGFLYFEKFFGSAMFGQLMWNSIFLSFYQLLVFFPFPLALAPARSSPRPASWCCTRCTSSSSRR